VLPAVDEEDGKYAHLIVSRAGKVIGVKSGFRYDGSRVPTGSTESEERNSDTERNHPRSCSALGEYFSTLCCFKAVKFEDEIELTPE